MDDASSSPSMAASNSAAQEVNQGNLKTVPGPGPSSAGIHPQQFLQQQQHQQHLFPDLHQSAASNQRYNMSAMANALPPNVYQPHQPYGAAQHHQQPPMNQYSQSYYMPQIAHYYAPQMTGHHQSQPPMSMSPRPGNYYSSPVMMNQPQPGYYYPQPPPHPPAHHQHHNQQQQPPLPPHGYANLQHINQYMMPDMVVSGRKDSVPGSARDSLGPNENSSGSRPTVTRGPPRKPKQSGHAIWIGNLPPNTDLMALVNHICGETPGLESLFLISKSNCAFANFRDEETCVAAQQNLHESKFQSIRLVSRLRRSTVEGSAGQTAPTGPAAISPTAELQTEEEDSSPEPASTAAAELEEKPEVASDQRPAPKITSDTVHQKDKFFILKSLTVEDLELSVRNEVWATQSHNEEALSNAFASADNVYLVFSANKSGEYFGYAKMVSSINEDPAAAIQFAPKVQVTNDDDVPKAVPTEATENCPRGRIIDDSARGTIFWEVERDEADSTAEDESEDSGSVKSGQDSEVENKAWGKPFKLKWLSTTRLPFYRTRGLRNPWNTNREVKIARDGTELEPQVGKRLIGLFNRVQSPGPPPMVARHGSIPAMAGFPPPHQPIVHYRT